jgi:hypothetical protein
LKEDVSRRAKQDPRQERKFLFCMLKDRNQKVDVKICRKKDCTYLEDKEECGIVDCHCPISMGYVSSFKTGWKKRRNEQLEKEELQKE